MLEPDRFSDDFDLAHRCLQGDPRALAQLQKKHGEVVKCFLLRAGALPAEAKEVVETLWTDLVVAHGNRLARLTFYSGDCALSTWLNTVALNELLSRKRRARRREQLNPQIGTHLEPRDASEAPVIELMQLAINAAFTDCDPEDFVLLQLAHCDRLQRQELARLFHYSEKTLRQRLAAAEERIAQTTLDFVRERDPWLELRWEDFMDLCRAATPACFGLAS